MVNLEVVDVVLEPGLALIGNVVDAYTCLCQEWRIQCSLELGYSMYQSFYGGGIPIFGNKIRNSYYINMCIYNHLDWKI